jgi:uncharacterized OB-fold protein
VTVRREAMFPPEMPRPQVEALSEPFWAAAREGRLVIQRCSACGAFRHLPHVMCASCQSSECEWVESAGQGTVFTYTIVTHSVHEATKSVVPYNVALVQLDDCGGVLLPSNVVECPPEAVHVGMAVKVVFERVDDEIAIPRFAPREQAAPGAR